MRKRLSPQNSVTAVVLKLHTNKYRKLLPLPTSEITNSAAPEPEGSSPHSREVNIKEGKMAVPFGLHSELNVLTDSVQVVKEFRQLAWTVSQMTNVST
jgi:hypothetical protein